MYYCPRCGNGVSGGVRFCPRCGNPFVSANPLAAAIPAAAGAAAAVAEKASKRWLKKTLITLLILAIIAAVVYFSGVWKSDEVLIRERIESFEKDYNKGDWDDVIENFDGRTRKAYKAISSLFKVSTTFSIGDSTKLGLSTDFASLFALGSYATDSDVEIEIERMKISGDTATVWIAIRYKSRSITETLRGTFKMVKEGHDWYIRDGGD